MIDLKFYMVDKHNINSVSNERLMNYEFVKKVKDEYKLNFLNLYRCKLNINIQYFLIMVMGEHSFFDINNDFTIQHFIYKSRYYIYVPIK